MRLELSRTNYSQAIKLKHIEDDISNTEYLVSDAGATDYFVRLKRTRENYYGFMAPEDDAIFEMTFYWFCREGARDKGSY